MVLPAVAGRQNVVWRMALTVFSTDGATHEWRIQENGVDKTGFYVPNGSAIVLDAGQVSWIRTPVNTSVGFWFSSPNVRMKGSIRAEAVVPS